MGRRAKRAIRDNICFQLRSFLLLLLYVTCSSGDKDPVQTLNEMKEVLANLPQFQQEKERVGYVHFTYALETENPSVRFTGITNRIIVLF